jgi:hypothetical protein
MTIQPSSQSCRVGIEDVNPAYDQNKQTEVIDPVVQTNQNGTAIDCVSHLLIREEAFDPGLE